MKLEKNKTYISREGIIYRITDYDFDKALYPIEGFTLDNKNKTIQEFWQTDGKWDINGENKRDLIKEITLEDDPEYFL